MSRVVLLVCLLMLVSTAVTLDLPGAPKTPDLSKVPGDIPKLPETNLPDAKTFTDLDDTK